MWHASWTNQHACCGHGVRSTLARSWSLSQTQSIMLQNALVAPVSSTTNGGSCSMLQLRKTMKYGGSSNGAQGANALQILLTRLLLLSISGLFFANWLWKIMWTAFWKALLYISALGGTFGPFACDLAKTFQVTLKCEAGNCWQSVAGRLQG